MFRSKPKAQAVPSKVATAASNPFSTSSPSSDNPFADHADDDGDNEPEHAFRRQPTKIQQNSLQSKPVTRVASTAPNFEASDEEDDEPAKPPHSRSAAASHKQHSSSATSNPFASHDEPAAAIVGKKHPATWKSANPFGEEEEEEDEELQPRSKPPTKAAASKVVSTAANPFELDDEPEISLAPIKGKVNGSSPSTIASKKQQPEVVVVQQKTGEAILQKPSNAGITSSSSSSLPKTTAHSTSKPSKESAVVPTSSTSNLPAAARLVTPVIDDDPFNMARRVPPKHVDHSEEQLNQEEEDGDDEDADDADDDDDPGDQEQSEDVDPAASTQLRESKPASILTGTVVQAAVASTKFHGGQAAIVTVPLPIASVPLDFSTQMAKMAKESHLLSLDSFDSRFDSNQFLLEASKPMLQLIAKRTQAVHSSKTSASELSAHEWYSALPFTQFCRHTLQQVDALREDLDEKLLSQSQACEQMQQEHEALMLSLTQRLKGLAAQFESLDEGIQRVSSTAIRIGAQLEVVDTQKKNAEKAVQLIRYYLSFVAGEADQELMLMAQQEVSTLMLAAELVQSLLSIALDLQSGNAQQAQSTAIVSSIEDTTLRIQQELLTRFFAALTRLSNAQSPSASALEELKAMAAVLLAFKGRLLTEAYTERVCQRFLQQVHQNDGAEFQADSEALLQEAASASEPIQMRGVRDLEARMNEDEPMAAASLELLRVCRENVLRIFAAMLSTVRDECNTLQTIFPSSFQMTRALIERLFQVHALPLVQAQLQSAAQAPDAEVHLLALAHAHLLIVRLLAALEVLARQAASAAPLSLGVGSDAFSTLLATSHAQLTSDPRGFQYLQKETQLLLSYCQKSVANSFRVEPAQRGGSGGESKRVWSDRQQQVLSSLQSGAIDECLKALTVSMRRCLVLTEPAQQPDAVAALFRVALQVLVHDLMERALQDAAPASGNAATAPVDYFYLALARECTDLIERLTQHYTYMVAPYLGANPNAISTVESQLHQAFSQMEARILTGLQRALDLTCAGFQRALATQKATDYRPKDDGTMSFQRSDACQAACAIFSRATDYAMRFLGGRNLDAFLTAFGMRCAQLLIEHVQHCSISAVGCSQLLNDLKLFDETAAMLHLPAVLERFQSLRFLAQMYFVSSDNLIAFFKEPRVVKMKLSPAELLAFVKARHDYAQIRPHLKLLEENAVH